MLPATSSLALFSVAALRVESASPESRCKRGSMHTSWRTSVKIKVGCEVAHFIVPNDGKHVRACSVVKMALQTHFSRQVSRCPVVVKAECIAKAL